MAATTAFAAVSDDSTDVVMADEPHSPDHENQMTDDTEYVQVAPQAEDGVEEEEGEDEEDEEADVNTEEDNRRTALRKAMLAIQTNSDLSPAEKSKRMQELMTSQWKASKTNARQHSTAEGDDPGSREPTAEDREATYHHRESMTLGCKHYQRGAKLQASCCGKWYTCRFCHDEDNDHALIRHETKNMLCMHCGTVQPAAQKCVNSACARQLARYYCAECKLWDDDPRKDIYHCDECKICRIGKGLGKDFIHCKTCNVCMAIALQDRHKCIERNLESDCPICGEYMFTSTTTVIFMPCGHCIHYTCHEEYIQTSYSCPTCFKSLGDMTSYFERIDAVLAQQKMPPEYENFVSHILCNDCEKKSHAKYNFLYHKCGECGSYNTKVLQTLQVDPDGHASSAPAAAVGAAAQMTREEMAGGQSPMRHSDPAERGVEGTEHLHAAGDIGSMISNSRNRSGSTTSSHRPSLSDVGLVSTVVRQEIEEEP